MIKPITVKKPSLKAVRILKFHSEKVYEQTTAPDEMKLASFQQLHFQIEGVHSNKALSDF